MFRGKRPLDTYTVVFFMFPDMLEAQELINLIISIIFFVYMFFFVGIKRVAFWSFSFLGIIFIFISQVATILEGFYLPQFFNIVEHIFYTLACVLFLISLLKKELILNNDSNI